MYEISYTYMCYIILNILTFLVVRTSFTGSIWHPIKKDREVLYCEKIWVMRLRLKSA